ncbi:MAG: dihydroneopterin aldolase [SAR324 cluster bacterium]|nr:dihydroneopterin aldolase [SAR324 cluster bacterium]
MAITIKLRNMIFFAYHGAFPEENTLGQRFEIDLEYVFFGQEAIASDQLKDTISYVDIYQIIRETIEQQQFRLLEKLGDTIMDEIYQAFPRIQRIQIRIRKPSAPIPGVLDHVEIEMNREKSIV